METSWTNAGSVAVTESLKTTATATATNSMHSVNAEVPVKPTMMLMASATT